MLDLLYLPTTKDINRDFYTGDSDNFAKEISAGHSYLLGLKYVTKNDITITSEYLYQSEGLTKDEIATTSKVEPFIAKSYMINKLSTKEPFDTLYASAYFKDMLNLEDKSHLDSLGYHFFGLF